MSELYCFHVHDFMDGSGCYDDIEGVHFILLSLLRGTLEFQSAISVTEPYHRSGYIR